MTPSCPWYIANQNAMMKPLITNGKLKAMMILLSIIQSISILTTMLVQLVASLCTLLMLNKEWLMRMPLLPLRMQLGLNKNNSSTPTSTGMELLTSSQMDMVLTTTYMILLLYCQCLHLFKVSGMVMIRLHSLITHQRDGLESAHIQVALMIKVKEKLHLQSSQAIHMMSTITSLSCT